MLWSHAELQGFTVVPEGHLGLGYVLDEAISSRRFQQALPIIHVLWSSEPGQGVTDDVVPPAIEGYIWFARKIAGVIPVNSHSYPYSRERGTDIDLVLDGDLEGIKRRVRESWDDMPGRHSWAYLARLSIFSGDLSLAHELAGMAIEQTPGNAAAWAIMSAVARGQGKADEALKAARKVCDLEPRVASHFALLAACEQESGNEGAAAAAAQMARSLGFAG